MRSGRARRVWVILHRWIGLVIAAWLVVLGLSGSVLVFHPEIDRALNPDWTTPQSTGAPASMKRVLESAQRAMPDRFLHSVFPPSDASDVHHVWFTPSAADQGRMWEVLVDPNDARVLGQREAVPTTEFSRRNLVNATYTLHLDLLMGELGNVGVGVVGLLALVSCGTGLVLWWPRGGHGWRRAITIKPGARGVRLQFDLHRVFAIYSVALLIVVLFTGVTLIFSSQTRAVLAQVSTVRPHPLVPPAESAGASEDADRVLAAAAAEFPGSRIRCLWLPGASGSSWRVSLAEPRGVGLAGGRAELWSDPRDGTVVVMHRYGDASSADIYLAWQVPLHGGRAFGLAGRVIVCLLGFVPLLLAVTGASIWWRKRRGRRHALVSSADRS